MSQTQEQIQSQVTSKHEALGSQSGAQQQSENDEYTKLKQAGFSDSEIQEYMRPQLKSAGFADQEINEYFNKYQIALGNQDVSAKASLSQYFSHGFEGSVVGLAANNKLPDSVTEEQLKNADWLDRLALGVGQLLGDVPTYAVGGIAGVFAAAPTGGAAAPITAPAGAMALTEGMRAAYMERIAAGHTEDYSYLKGAFNILQATAKGFDIGALTGASGAAVGGRLAATGINSTAQTAGKMGAEVATMTTASAAMEGKLPHPQDFVDAVILVGAMHGARSAYGRSKGLISDITPKLRDIYAKTGKTPEEVATRAQEDPTVRQDLLSVNRDIPESFATDVINKLKAGESVTAEELSVYKETPWAQAAMNEKIGHGEIGKKLENMYNDASNGVNLQENLPWGFIRDEEAKKISDRTGLNISGGFSHVVNASSLKHAFDEHGVGNEKVPGQIPIVAEDISRIPEIVRGENVRISHEKKTKKTNLDGIVYEKEYQDGTIFYVEEVRSGKHALAFKTMWKRKRSSKDDRSPDLYVQDGEDMLRVVDVEKADSDRIVSGNTDVNKQPSENSASTPPDALHSTGGSTEIPISSNKPTIPANGKLRHEDAIALSSVVDNLAKTLDTPIRVGKMGTGRGVLGLFKVKPEVIRTRVANDIATITHEAGHAIQKALFGSIDESPLKPFEAELAPIATEPRPGQSNLPEGFAEFVSKYVVNPEEAKQVAPKFYAHFEQLLQTQSPEFATALLNAREAVRKYAEQPAALEVLSHINIEGREKEGLLARALSRDTWDRLYTNFVDRLFPLKKATELMTNGQELPPDMDPYILARTFAGAKGKATHFLEHSPFKYGSWENVGKSLADTLKAAENLDEFRAYLVSRRGLELEDRGIRSGIRREAMQATKDQFAQKYEPLAKELDEYQNHLVNYLVDSGILSEKSAEAMRAMNKNYVPFFRVMEEGKDGFLGGGKNFSARNPVRRIKGSGRDIIDPLESIIKNTYAMIEAAEKNGVGKALTDLAESTEGSGWLVERIPTPKQAVKVNREQVNSAFLEALGDMEPEMQEAVKSTLESGAADEMVTFWQNSTMLDKQSQIAVFRDGKRQIYQVAPELAEVMNGLNAETVPLLVKLVSIPAKMLRAGATLTPDFMVRNLLRDAISSGVVSRSGFIPGIDTAKGLKSASTKDETYWNWVKAGGDQASVVSMDRTTLHKKVGDLAATGYPERVWNVVKNPMELLRLGSELSEKMTRIGEFGKAAKQHGTDKPGLMRAAYESRDLMDFSRRGGARLIASFNIMTAFFNASVQGLDRTVRGFKENPKRFALRAALYIGIPSIINAVRNYGDEDIAEVPRAQRDMFWCVPIGEGKGKTIVRIPKPFEQGVMFGSTLERATEFLLDAYHKKYGSVAKAREEAFRGLGASIFDVSLPNAVPTAVAPFIEHFANRSLPFDRPIVPKSREDLLPEYQYAPYTTELMKSLAHYVGVLPPVGELNTFSPARAENYVRGWTGGLGMYVLQGLDAMGRKASLLPDPVKPADTLADVPFVRAFVIRNPSMGAESIQRFYDNYDKAHSYLKTINSLQKDFKYEDVANLLPYSVYQAVEGPKKTINEITKAIDLINKAPDMNADQKRQLIDNLYFRAIDSAKLGNQVFEQLRPDIERLKKRAGK